MRLIVPRDVLTVFVTSAERIQFYPEKASVKSVMKHELQQFRNALTAGMRVSMIIGNEKITCFSPIKRCKNDKNNEKFYEQLKAG